MTDGLATVDLGRRLISRRTRTRPSLLARISWAVSVPVPSSPRLKPPDRHVKQIQQRLIKLGYLLPGAADGRLGPVTEEGILAFQKWERLDREWLPWALPFVGGIAFHEYLNVPSYAASHGCVRQPPAVARGTYAFAEVGMPVKVIANS